MVERARPGAMLVGDNVVSGRRAVSRFAGGDAARHVHGAVLVHHRPLAREVDHNLVFVFPLLRVVANDQLLRLDVPSL